jgi:magnesium-transporting ATPase (P-type)
LAIIFGRTNKDVMKEKPRDTEGIFNRRLVIALSIYALSLAFMFYLVYYETLNGFIPFDTQGNTTSLVNFSSLTGNHYDPVGWAQAKARTMLLAVVVVAECPFVFSLAQMNKPIHATMKDKDYRNVWPYVLAIPIAFLLLMYVPAIQSFMVGLLGITLEIIPLTLIDWLIVLAIGVIPILLMELYKATVRKRHLYF